MKIKLKCAPSFAMKKINQNIAVWENKLQNIYQTKNLYSEYVKYANNIVLGQ